MALVFISLLAWISNALTYLWLLLVLIIIFEQIQRALLHNFDKINVSSAGDKSSHIFGLHNGRMPNKLHSMILVILYLMWDNSNNNNNNNDNNNNNNSFSWFLVLTVMIVIP